LTLADADLVYEDIASKFFEHFLFIAHAMADVAESGYGLWNEQDQFYYDVLNLPDGEMMPLRIRSLVGLIPLFAVEILDSSVWDRHRGFRGRAEWMLTHRPDLAAQVSRWREPGKENRWLLSLLRRHRMKALLMRMLDETEFLSDFGIRSVSKAHKKEPFALECNGSRFLLDYEPGESTTAEFGGNSNWRGPIWFPINYLLIESLYKFEGFYGQEFRVEYPTNSGCFMSLSEIATALSGRLTRLFLRDTAGRRPCLGAHPIYQEDPAFRDLIAFNEYFHGDTGEGLGASHQTGWTALVALLLQPRRRMSGYLSPAAPGVTADATAPASAPVRG
jgi:hypothetical protein